MTLFKTLYNRTKSKEENNEIISKYLKDEIMKTSDKNGIISGHGSSVAGKLCMVPSNLCIRPMCCQNDIVEVSKKHNNWLKSSDRALESGFSCLGKSNYDNYYYPTQFIPELIINFAMIWDNPKRYSITGIITDDITDDSWKDNGGIKKFHNYDLLDNLQSDDIIRKDSLKFHNNHIILNEDYNGEPTNGDIWNKNFYLSQILNAISKAVKLNNSLPTIYWLQTCRNSILPNITCNHCRLENINWEKTNLELDTTKKPVLMRSNSINKIDKLKSFYIDLIYFYINIFSDFRKWKKKVILDRYIFPYKPLDNSIYLYLYKNINNQIKTILHQIYIEKNISYYQFCHFDSLMNNYICYTWITSITNYLRYSDTRSLDTIDVSVPSSNLTYHENLHIEKGGLEYELDYTQNKIEETKKLKHSIQQRSEDVKLRMKKMLDVSDELKELYEDNRKILRKNSSILESIKKENEEADIMIERLLNSNKRVTDGYLIDQQIFDNNLKELSIINIKLKNLEDKIVSINKKLKPLDSGGRF